MVSRITLSYELIWLFIMGLGLTLWTTGIAQADNPPLKPAGAVSPAEPPDQWRTYTDGNKVLALAVTRDSLWTPTSGGVLHWSRIDDSYRKYTTLEGLGSNDVRAIAIDKPGQVWAGTAGGLSKFDGQRWTTYTVADGLVDNNVYAIALEATGRLWVGTAGGVGEFDGQTWHTYTQADGLVNNEVHVITIDQAGHKWFGTTRGLSEFDGHTWITHRPDEDDLPVSAIAVDKAGQIWAALKKSNSSHCDGGIYEFNGKVWNWHLQKCGYNTIAFDPAGQAWVGGDGFIDTFDGCTWTSELKTEGWPIHAEWISAIVIDEAGHIWFATPHGVSEMDNQVWRTYATTNSLVGNNVYSLASDPAGHIWASTVGWGELNEFDGQSWRTYTQADGLINNWVHDIATDSAGNVWFATAGGVGKFDGQRWSSYTTADGLASNQVNEIVIDELGQLWFGTLNGISEFGVNLPPALVAAPVITTTVVLPPRPTVEPASSAPLRHGPPGEWHNYTKTTSFSTYAVAGD